MHNCSSIGMRIGSHMYMENRVRLANIEHNVYFQWVIKKQGANTFQK